MPGHWNASFRFSLLSSIQSWRRLPIRFIKKQLHGLTPITELAPAPAAATAWLPTAASNAAAVIIEAALEVLQKLKVCEVGPQRSSALSTDSFANEIEDLQRRKAGEVWPQLSETLSTYFVVADIKVL